jgi:hypothetical protein
MKHIIIKSCQECPHSYSDQVNIVCWVLQTELDTRKYPVIPKNCPLADHRDPRIQYQD